MGLKSSYSVPGANLEFFIPFGQRVWPLCLDTQTYMHTQIYMHMHADTNIHAHACTHMHAPTCPPIHPPTHTYEPKYNRYTLYYKCKIKVKFSANRWYADSSNFRINTRSSFDGSFKIPEEISMYSKDKIGSPKIQH